jgi:LCP family protein required for cell wall assembly
MRTISIGLVLVIIASIGGFFLYAQVINGLFTRTKLDLDPAHGKAMNILLVGSDSREGFETALDKARYGGPESVSGRRADTIILAQIIPREQRGVLLSFPRDLWVTIHENGHEFRSKINSAYGYGPQAMIDTVGALTGVPINHFMEVNLYGFRRMVDAIGGIDVCLPQAIYDSQLNYSLKSGPNHLDGVSALNFVRARYATPGGDFDRIKRQQQFMRAVMAKVGRPAVLGNPLKVNSLARAFAQNVKVDQFFQLDDMVRFALSVRRVGVDQLETYGVPGQIGNIGGASVVIIDDVPAQKLFGALQNQQDPKQVLAGPATPKPAQPAAPRTTTTVTKSAAASGPCPAGTT